jgi:zinc transporter ZupT
MARLPVPDPEDLLLARMVPVARGATGGGGSSPIPAPVTSGHGLHSTGAAMPPPGSAQASWRLGFLVLAIMTMHNLPEGLAVGVSAVKSPHLGWLLAIAM